MHPSAAIIVGYLLGVALAFGPSRNVLGPRKTGGPLRMSTEAVPITVTGNNIEVTPALNDYIIKKLERTVSKLASSGAVKDCDVHLVVNKNPKVRIWRAIGSGATGSGVVEKGEKDTEFGRF